LLVDSDPQGSARDWRAVTGEESDLPPVIGLDRGSGFRELPRLARSYDWVVIDGAPQIEELAIAAIRVSDAVLVPVQPSPYDIWSTESVVEIVKRQQEREASRPKAALVISRQIAGTRLAQEIREALQEYGLPIMTADTTQRLAYPHSAAQGVSVLDTEPAGATPLKKFCN
jgi:chromosome partitioning protein